MGLFLDHCGNRPPLLHPPPQHRLQTFTGLLAGSTHPSLFKNLHLTGNFSSPSDTEYTEIRQKQVNICGDAANLCFLCYLWHAVWVVSYRGLFSEELSNWECVLDAKQCMTRLLQNMTINPLLMFASIYSRHVRYSLFLANRKRELRWWWKSLTITLFILKRALINWKMT